VRQSLLALVRRLPQPQAEIGAQRGVSQQRIAQVETQALTWLRQPAHSQQQYELANQLAQRPWLRWRGGRPDDRRTNINLFLRGACIDPQFDQRQFIRTQVQEMLATLDLNQQTVS
jgi:hypothetical protein